MPFQSLSFFSSLLDKDFLSSKGPCFYTHLHFFCSPGSSDLRDDAVVSEIGKTAENYEVILRVDDSNLLVKCIVKNSVGNNSANIRVEIQGAPRVSDIQVLINGVVKTNNKVDLGADREEELTLRCIYTPPSATIQWFKIVNGSKTSVSTGPDYNITVKHTNDKDTYKCKASKTGETTAESDNIVLFLASPVEATFQE